MASVVYIADGMSSINISISIPVNMRLAIAQQRDSIVIDLFCQALKSDNELLCIGKQNGILKYALCFLFLRRSLVFLRRDYNMVIIFRVVSDRIALIKT